MVFSMVQMIRMWVTGVIGMFIIIYILMDNRLRIILKWTAHRAHVCTLIIFSTTGTRKEMPSQILSRRHWITITTISGRHDIPSVHFRQHNILAYLRGVLRIFVSNFLKILQPRQCRRLIL